MQPDQTKLDELVRRIVEAVHPLRIIYWGKASKTDPGCCHLLPYHCLDVAAVAKELLNRDCLWRERLAARLTKADRAIPLLTYLLALHDVGKFADGFQNQETDLLFRLRGERREATYATRHDVMGLVALEQIVWPILKRQGRVFCRVPRRLHVGLARCVEPIEGLVSDLGFLLGSLCRLTPLYYSTRARE